MSQPLSDLLAAGDRVQLTDAKGRLNTIELTPGETFQTHRGYLRHDELIGQPEGIVVTSTGGTDYQVLRPLMHDYIMSMPRGAAVIYPKDSAQIITFGDVFPGATVLEAGVGSGALTMSLLRAIGPTGQLLSIERRQDFAEIAEHNVSGHPHVPLDAWQLRVGDFGEICQEYVADHSVDRVLLDMLDPWEHVAQVARVLKPGGLFLTYVATTTQLSRVAETLREHGSFTEPQGWETMVRNWHLEGLAVRPDHRMVGHTGFLLTARTMSPGHKPLLRKRRPAKSSQETDENVDLATFEPSEVAMSKKIRRLRRDIARNSRVLNNRAQEPWPPPQAAPESESPESSR